MYKICLTVILLLMYQASNFAQTPTDWANFSKYEALNESVNPGQIVFMGNSITEGWERTDPTFFTKNGYICRGIGGQTTMQMLVRFRKDVIDLQPKAVVILAGTNDIAQNQGYISLENTFGNIISMVELAQAHQIRVVLCSVLPATEFRWRPHVKPADDIIALNKMIKDYAVQHDIPFVDYHTALKDEHNGLPKMYADDGVHPNLPAYKIMQDILDPILQQIK